MHENNAPVGEVGLSARPVLPNSDVVAHDHMNCIDTEGFNGASHLANLDCSDALDDCVNDFVQSPRGENCSNGC